MATLLLILIYLAFISLGLPDSIIGVSWPVMKTDFDVPLEYGGYISLIITLGTIISSLLSGFLIKKLGTGAIISLSIFLTAFALLGYSFSDNYAFIILFALPLGFGAGSIDTALNNYVALHYKSHHMNWLHSFWGVGASIGPAIMAYFLLDKNWQKGFLTIAIIQFSLMVIITIFLPFWNKQEHNHNKRVEVPTQTPKKLREINGVFIALMIFLVYCAIEFSIGIWGSSYLVLSKSLDVSMAARIMTLYYLGITAGRFISGIISIFTANKNLIYGGIAIIFFAGILLFLGRSQAVLVLSFGLLGLGLAPIFPSMMHDTPKNFGEENSQYVVGYQIAFAYTGSAIFPSLFGLLYANISISLFPLTIFILVSILLIMVVYLTLVVKRNRVL